MTTSDIVNRLRTNRECYAPCLFDEAADEIVRLEAALVAVTQERDEARREVCRLDAELPEERLVSYCAARLPKDVAAKRGWDCFDRSKYAKRRKPIAK